VQINDDDDDDSFNPSPKFVNPHEQLH